ncbi:hypothetical protein SAMN05421771_1858 [Granulicella pectinivorans]|uniref:Uncharacterized protein n=1 Tax=Granulicella pectinivorans TaxID=474950 RepID=A0A1I6M5B0_9BACT|nr:DUF5677 domain-containing protein [Granulicella pectinivorans]SFS10859.1 hypothetical protein SAMN05421771_1858 [Granulicella pectinivorans]
MTNEELDSEYSKGLETFRKIVLQAIRLHAKVREMPFQGVAPSARLLFARLCFISVSLARICPKLENEKDIWDFATIALLSRSLFESIMFFEYFCETSGPDEWMAKMYLLNLHDRCDRIRLFTAMDKPLDVAGFTGEAEILRGLLRNNPFFAGLEAKRQKELLKGYKAAFLSLREMGNKFSPDADSWVIYDFLSTYAHSLPVSFMRNSDDRRDGLQNDVDKMYTPGVLTWLAALLDHARSTYLGVPTGMMLET